MKLGTETASLVNHLISRTAYPDPQVGDGATIAFWSDRTAGTVVAVDRLHNFVLVEVAEDAWKVVSGSGHDGSAEYEFEPNELGRRYFFRKRYNEPTWAAVFLNAETGRWIREHSRAVRFGVREKFIDPTF